MDFRQNLPLTNPVSPIRDIIIMKYFYGCKIILGNLGIVFVFNFFLTCFRQAIQISDIGMPPLYYRASRNWKFLGMGHQGYQIEVNIMPWDRVLEEA